MNYPYKKGWYNSVTGRRYTYYRDHYFQHWKSNNPPFKYEDPKPLPKLERGVYQTETGYSLSPSYDKKQDKSLLRVDTRLPGKKVNSTLPSVGGDTSPPKRKKVLKMYPVSGPLGGMKLRLKGQSRDKPSTKTRTKTELERQPSSLTDLKKKTATKRKIKLYPFPRFKLRKRDRRIPKTNVQTPKKTPSITFSPQGNKKREEKKKLRNWFVTCFNGFSY